MRSYELVVVFRPSLKEAESKKLLESIKSWLQETKINKEDDWGQKPLAYMIKKESAGHYYFWQLEAEAGVPADLEKRILENNNVLRHLLLRTK